MQINPKEIIEELKTVGSGKTFDSLLPPLIFVIINRTFGLNIAVITALSLAFIFVINRLLKKQSWYYALGGLFGVSLASGFAYLTKSAVGYFIPGIIISFFILLLTLISLIIDKPLAIWGSHITRGWPLKWFERKDIKPAYREVTWLWAVFLLLRLILQIILFLNSNGVQLTWINILLGWPFTIFILILSYLYGLWRLQNLGGPGVQEYQNDKKPPWEGQKRGF